MTRRVLIKKDAEEPAPIVSDKPIPSKEDMEFITENYSLLKEMLAKFKEEKQT